MNVDHAKSKKQRCAIEPSKFLGGCCRRFCADFAKTVKPGNVVMSHRLPAGRQCFSGERINIKDQPETHIKHDLYPGWMGACIGWCPKQELPPCGRMSLPTSQIAVYIHVCLDLITGVRASSAGARYQQKTEHTVDDAD